VLGRIFGLQEPYLSNLKRLFSVTGIGGGPNWLTAVYLERWLWNGNGD